MHQWPKGIIFFTLVPCLILIHYSSTMIFSTTNTVKTSYLVSKSFLFANTKISIKIHFIYVKHQQTTRDKLLQLHLWFLSFKFPKLLRCPFKSIALYYYFIFLRGHRGKFSCNLARDLSVWIPIPALAAPPGNFWSRRCRKNINTLLH